MPGERTEYFLGGYAGGLGGREDDSGVWSGAAIPLSPPVTPTRRATDRQQT